MEYLKFYSQVGQDKYVYENFFKSKLKGVFLDIGAHNGIDKSNSYFFERHLGWSGLCVEPMPDVFDQLIKNRNCICENIAISDYCGKATFWKINGYAEMLSGLVENYDERHKSRIENELRIHGGDLVQSEVVILDINTLLKSNNLYEIDYCSIDVEGSEEKIMSAFNEKEFDIKVFTIENNYQSENFRKLMKYKGYKLFSKIDCDDVYIKKIKKWFFFF
jgi:FkbM family methyltransferase